MKRILTAVILIPAVLCVVFLAPYWVFVLVVAAVAALAGWECMALARHAGYQPPRVAVLIALLALFAGAYQYPDRIGILFGLLSILLFVYCTFSRAPDRVLGDAAASVFCLFYTGFTLLALLALREESNGPSVLLFLFFVVWAGDSAALYAGRYWGRRKLAPVLSPRKTWAGAVGSLIASVAIAYGLFEAAYALETHWNSVILSYPDEFWYWLVLAVVVNIAAQVGDLAESALKRSAGVKDSGVLLPGHGGMLDRIDALLFAAPVLWYAQVIRQMF